MELKLKKNFEEAYIYVPFTKSNVMGKFIDKGLYPHLVKLYPDAFEVEVQKGLKQKIQEIKKEEKVDDILINDNTIKGDTTNK